LTTSLAYWYRSINSEMDTLLTAEMAINSPRFRRKSSTFVDAIHDLPESGEMAPAQLYSTESGPSFTLDELRLQQSASLPEARPTSLWLLHGISAGLE
jgi:hypothetical protein